MKITCKQIEDAMKAKEITEVDHHECMLCGYMTKYIYIGKKLYFDSGCLCVNDLKLRHCMTYNELTDWINIQNTTEKINIVKKLTLER